MYRRVLLSALLPATLMAGLVVSVASAKQATCQVSNQRTGVATKSTLQEGIDVAVTGDTLVVKGTCEGSSTVDKALTLKGVSNKTFGEPVLDGKQQGSVIKVAEPVDVTISGVKVTNGKAPEGGGILNTAGNVTLEKVQITENQATAQGGGIANKGNLVLTNSEVSKNKAATGGGIYNESSLKLTNTAVTQNEAGKAGGIYNAPGATVTRDSKSSEAGNVSTSSPPSASCSVTNAAASTSVYGSLTDAVDASTAGDTLIVRGICYGDTAINRPLTLTGQPSPGYSAPTLDAGGALKPTVWVEFTTLIMSGLTITGGNGFVGGGFYNNGSSLTLTNSTITGNVAWAGGGIFSDFGASATLIDSHVTLNSATFGGGGVWNNDSSTLTLIGTSTVTGNIPDDIAP